MSDILIIGAGISGLSLAARLTGAAQVTVLEAEDHPGYHASGRSAALFEPDYGVPAVKLLSHASAEFYHTANGGYLTERGFLMVGAPDQEALFQQTLTDLNLSQIAPEEAVARFGALDPARVGFAGFHAGAWDIDTDRLLQDCARAVRANGGQVLCRHGVTEIHRNGRWQVTAGGAEFAADLLVNAAGAWADEIAILAGVTPVGLMPRRRSMARIAAPGGLDVSGWPMVLGAGETWYAKPDAGALIVSPADADPAPPQDAWADDMVLAEGLARYEDMMRYPVTRPMASWAGLRTYAPDDCPVLGRDPACPAFLWCAGQGGSGFQIAPGAADLLDAQITGNASHFPQDLIDRVAPDRFRR